MTVHPKEPEFCQQYTKQRLLSPGNRTTGWHFSISEILAITFFATAHSFRAASELSPQRPALQKMERTKNVTEATAHFLQGAIRRVRPLQRNCPTVFPVWISRAF